MPQIQDDEVQRIAALWLERFGEPPPILTDAALMLRILDSMSADAMSRVADLPPLNFM
jgi:hypothetical protein